MAHEPKQAYRLFLQIKFPWKTAITVSLHIVYGCFCATTELSNCSRDYNGSESIKHLLSGILQKNFEDLWCTHSIQGFCLFACLLVHSSCFSSFSFLELVHDLSVSQSPFLFTSSSWVVHRSLCSRTSSFSTFGPATKTHLQELINHKVTFIQNQGFPILLTLKVKRDLFRFPYSKQVESMHHSQQKERTEGQSDFSDLFLSGWDADHPANAHPYQTEPTGLLSPFLWSVESCSTERNIFEHDKHLITVFNFTWCLLGLTGNEEGKSISCCFIRYLQ